MENEVSIIELTVGPFSFQIGTPLEEDLKNWAHHRSPSTIPDALLQIAAGDEVHITCVTVTLSLLKSSYCPDRVTGTSNSDYRCLMVAAGYIRFHLSGRW